MPATFYWHDYETWGSDPRRDWPCQFAGLRTDGDLNEIGAPTVVYCRPPEDRLPHPDACLITRLAPQTAQERGLPESEFAAAIERELAAPGTCGAGYNSMRFDDEVTRHLLYRNLRDPYAREWQNGNSRWDLIDTLRLAHALRPEGIEWPLRDDGSASFRLEDLTAANGIPHAGAHDALADVRATIGLVRLLKRAQPRLFDYALGLRAKARVRELLDRRVPLLHTSARYPAAQGCIAPILALAPHPENPNAVLCFDLREDPLLLLDLSVEEIRARLFTPASDRPEGTPRIPIKGVRVNCAPVLAPMNTLTPVAAERWAIDPGRVADRARAAAGRAEALRARVQAVFAASGANGAEADGEGGGRSAASASDPDLMLYSGGFLSDADRRTLEGLRRLAPAELAQARPRFADRRLPEMLLRFRARNWPESLSQEERETWDAQRFARLTDPQAGATLVLDAFDRRLAELAQLHADRPERLDLLTALAEWAERLMDAGD